MSAERHHFPAGTFSDQEVQQQITDDITASRHAQQAAAVNGQSGLAASMGAAVDEHLDELAEAREGTWRPKHA